MKRAGVANRHPNGARTGEWNCAIPEEEGGGFDHDWEYRTDWAGDPGVINGTYNIYTRVCRACGAEEPVNALDMPTIDEDDYR